MNPLDRLTQAIEATLAALRRRHRGFDHFCRAVLRYDELLGGRLAAAIAYYGFFAVFALGLLAYSVFGFLLTYNLDLFEQVRDFLAENLPFLDIEVIRESRQAVGVAGLVGLLFTGVGWVEAIRSSQRLIWDLDQQPGNLVVRWLVDFAVLIGLLLLVAVSVTAVDAVESVLAWLAEGRLSRTQGVISWALTVVVNTVLAAALLAAVPRLRMTLRRLAPSITLVGAGLTLLNSVGRAFISYVENRPAYALVGGAVGLLIYLYVFNQLLLFGAALAATSAHGPVYDLSHRRPVRLPAPTDQPTAAPPAGAGRG